MTGTIRLSREYDAPVADLWDVVATRDGLASWLMENDFEPVAGHAFTFTTKPQPPLFDGVVGSRVLRIEPAPAAGDRVDRGRRRHHGDLRPASSTPTLNRPGFARG